MNPSASKKRRLAVNSRQPGVLQSSGAVIHFAFPASAAAPMVGTLGYFVDGRALLSTGLGEQEQSKRAIRRSGIRLSPTLNRDNFLLIVCR